MSKIAQTVATSKTVEVEYPDIEGFVVLLSYIPREELTKIQKRSTKIVFSRTTHQREEQIDNDTFLREYSDHAIKGWKGLKAKYLHKLYPADTSGLKDDEEIPYSQEDAYELLKVSTEFDNFITDCMRNVETFANNQKEEAVKN